MATIRMRMPMQWKKHHKPMLDLRRMWRTEETVGDSDENKCNDADTDEEE
jgi:hypothetical protein